MGIYTLLSRSQQCWNGNCSSNHNNAIKTHEWAKPDAINILDNKRQTALHTAVRHASYKVVNVLLQGVDHIKVDGKDSSGMAAMDIAVQATDYKLVLMLQLYFEAIGLYGTSKAYMQMLPMQFLWVQHCLRLSHVQHGYNPHLI